MNDPRDTQFQGFAKLLFEELKPDLTFLFLVLSRKDQQALKDHESVVQTIIAQRAYDLVCHAFDGISEGIEALYPEEAIAACVTDLTAWPEQEEKQS